MLFGNLDVEDPGKATIAVKEPLRKLYPWLETLVANRRAEALTAMRRTYAEPKVKRRSTDTATRRFLRVLRFKRRVDEWYKAVRLRILRYWAQHGLTKFNGTVIYTSFEAHLIYLEALAELLPAVRKQVIREIPVFDLGTFLELADKGEISREVVAKCLGGKLEVEVRLPHE